MPSKSFRQARTMAGAAHDPVFAKKVGVPTKVAKEFNKADDKSGFLGSAMRAKGPAFKEGGNVKKTRYAEGGGVDRDLEPQRAKAMSPSSKAEDRDLEPQRGNVMSPAYRAAKAKSDDYFRDRFDRDRLLNPPKSLPQKALEKVDDYLRGTRFTPPRAYRTGGAVKGSGSSKGGGVKGRGAEQRGTRPAKYY